MHATQFQSRINGGLRAACWAGLGLGLLFGAGSARCAEAGRVSFVVGEARVGARPAVLDAAVQEGDEIATGADGYVYMKTVDNGFLILRPRTRARVTAYHVDRDNPANTRIKLELLEGVARSISGEAVKKARQNFRFNTPVAAIGVRGTDFVVFTDQQVSRVAVFSGGVVVSGFGGGCGPEGGGPCEGGVSRELFAGQLGQLLQISRSQAAPQLLHDKTLAPDVNALPRGDEPGAKIQAPAPAAPAGAGVAVPVLTPAELTYDPKKADHILVVGKAPDPVKPPPAAVTPEAPVATPVPEVTAPVVTVPVVTVPVVVVTPPPVVPVAPVVPEAPVVLPAKAPEVLWGRWQALANLTPDAEAVAAFKSGAYGERQFVGSFKIARLGSTELVLPQAGKVGFTLDAGQSEVYLQKRGQDPVLAAIQDPRLNFDFGARTFSSTMTVVGAAGQVALHAGGDISLKGEFNSNLAQSNIKLNGYLGGADAREAAFIFATTGTPALSAFGGTRWGR